MNAKHRQPETIPGTQAMVKHAAAMVAIVAAGFILAVAVMAFFAAFQSQGVPANAAPSWQTRSVATLAAHATQLRPWWDGRHPRVWNNRRQPMCLPTFAHRHGWATTGGPEFRVECLPIGTEGWAWEPVS